jgi:hypothetical protein
MGTGWTPPPATGHFGDVPITSPFAPWIEELAHRGITSGCRKNLPPQKPDFCPGDPVSRGSMAVFLVTTFELSLE